MHVHLHTRARRVHVVRVLCVQVNFYDGPPFKFKGTAKSHERFPNCVRSSPARGVFLTRPLPDPYPSPGPSP